MLTKEATIDVTVPASRGSAIAPTTVARKIVIVDGSLAILELLEAALEAGHYDIAFVESNGHAYSHIKRVQPHLVILCVRIEGTDGFHVLSMLKLDEETRAIPVLTYTTGYEGRGTDQESPDRSDVEIFTPPPAMRMN